MHSMKHLQKDPFRTGLILSACQALWEIKKIDEKDGEVATGWPKETFDAFWRLVINRKKPWIEKTTVRK